jgi:hypothetical protein
LSRRESFFFSLENIYLFLYEKSPRWKTSSVLRILAKSVVFVNKINWCLLKKILLNRKNTSRLSHWKEAIQRFRKNETMATILIFFWYFDTAQSKNNHSLICWFVFRFFWLVDIFTYQFLNILGRLLSNKVELHKYNNKKTNNNNNNKKKQKKKPKQTNICVKVANYFAHDRYYRNRSIMKAVKLLLFTDLMSYQNNFTFLLKNRSARTYFMLKYYSLFIFLEK